MKKTILMYGQFGEDFWTGEGITAKNFLRQLEEANADAEVEELVIAINSPGGSVFEGTAIFNAIRQQNNTEGAKPIHTRNDGFAYSMGAVVLMAGKTVSAYKNSMCMIHNASGLAYGNVKRMESAVAQLKGIDANFADILAERLSLSADEVRQDYLDYNDHFYTATEAQDLGLIDELVEAESEAVNAVGSTDFKAVASYFQKNHGPSAQEESFWSHMKNRVAAYFPTKPAAPKPPTPDPQPPHNHEDIMKIKNDHSRLLAFFGLEPKAEGAEVEHAPTEEQIAQLEARLADAENLTAVQNDLQASQDEVSALQARITELEAGSGATPNSGAAGDATSDGGKAESFFSETDAELSALIGKETPDFSKPFNSNK